MTLQFFTIEFFSSFHQFYKFYSITNFMILQILKFYQFYNFTNFTSSLFFFLQFLSYFCVKHSFNLDKEELQFLSHIGAFGLSSNDLSRIMTQLLSC
jgi:hypothetical protein